MVYQTQSVRDPVFSVSYAKGVVLYAFDFIKEKLLNAKNDMARTGTLGLIIGSSRYYDWDAARREVAIGYTFLTRAHWGGATNRELKRLMVDWAFQYADRIWFHVGKHNLRSARAMEKIGAVLDHEEIKVLFGQAHPYLHFRIDQGMPLHLD